MGRDSAADGAFGVLFGTNYFGAAQLSGQFDIPIHLALDRKSQLLITYEILDDQGGRIAYLRNNEWWGVSGGYDRNFNADSFEMVSMDTGVPILQIRRGGNRAVILGIFRTRKGHVLVADLRGVHYGLPPTPTTCTWFRYPSTLHPGERDADCALPELPTGELPYPWR